MPPLAAPTCPAALVAICVLGAAVVGCGNVRTSGDLRVHAPGASATPPVGSGMVLGKAYPYRLSTHCGVQVAQIDGRTFYVDIPSGIRSRDIEDPGHPADDGTMTLVTHGMAVFRDGSGHVVPFVDHNPVTVGKSYSIDVELSTTGRLDSVFFAGGLFVAGDVLSGRLQPPSSDTTVSGTMTLIADDNARLQLQGAVVAYHRLAQYGCL